MNDPTKIEPYDNGELHGVPVPRKAPPEATPKPRVVLDLGLVDTRLCEWWRAQAESELAMLLPKVTSYGSVDLQSIGHALGLFANIELDQSKQEQLGIAFYLLGKVNRILSALQAGQNPNADSWVDAAVYARMGLRANQEGKWL